MRNGLLEKSEACININQVSVNSLSSQNNCEHKKSYFSQ